MGQRLRSARARRWFGLGVTLWLSAGAWAAVAALSGLPWVGLALGLYFAFAGLALGQLLREARAVSGLLCAGNLDQARRALSYLVSRDTSGLDEAALWRTLAETVSENYCDAFVAPLFYMCLGGPPVLWIYKTVSTMDSMWGYKTQRFVDIGCAAARADDVLAYIPARLAAASLLAAGLLMGLPARLALARLGADARAMSSPNAGWPMAACAWLLHSTMGGSAVYFGEFLQKPQLGPAGVDWNGRKIAVLIRLIYSAAFILIALSTLIFLLRDILFS